jgi:hypothetical protein
MFRLQLMLNGEVADAVAEIFAEQVQRRDEGETLGAVMFTKQGLDGSIVLAFGGDGRTFEISGGGTVDEV